MSDYRTSVYYVSRAQTTDGEPIAGWYFVDAFTDEPRGPYLSWERADEALRMDMAELMLKVRGAA